MRHEAVLFDLDNTLYPYTPYNEASKPAALAVGDACWDGSLDAIATEHGRFPPESVVTLMRELFGEGAAELWAEP